MRRRPLEIERQMALVWNHWPVVAANVAAVGAGASLRELVVIGAAVGETGAAGAHPVAAADGGHAAPATTMAGVTAQVAETVVLEGAEGVAILAGTPAMTAIVAGVASVRATVAGSVAWDVFALTVAVARARAVLALPTIVVTARGAEATPVSGRRM